MWWIIGIVIVGYIIYNINKDYKEHVKTHISNFGGMLKKYDLVISYLKSSGLSVQKITRSSVILSSRNMTCTLDYVGDNLEIRMNGFMPMMGKFNHKWIFPDGYPQEKMIEEFENYLNWKIERLKNAAQNNPYDHLNL